MFRCGKWINYANIFIYIQNKYLHTLNNLILCTAPCSASWCFWCSSSASIMMMVVPMLIIIIYWHFNITTSSSLKSDIGEPLMEMFKQKSHLRQLPTDRMWVTVANRPARLWCSIFVNLGIVWIFNAKNIKAPCQFQHQRRRKHDLQALRTTWRADLIFFCHNLITTTPPAQFSFYFLV